MKLPDLTGFLKVSEMLQPERFWAILIVAAIVRLLWALRPVLVA